jgi:predicted Zn-dependent protease
VSYQERLPPEGINASRENPLKEFVLLLGGLILLTVALVSVLVVFAERVAVYVPFDVELSLAESFAGQDAETPAELKLYLDELTANLAAASDLPEGMTITVHYVDGDTVNAFATLGGNIVLYRGLIEQMPDENALAMVIAHEIAHVKHRDPIASLGRGVIIQLAMNAIAGGTGADYVLGKGGLLTLLTFNREMEEDADEQAMQTLQTWYGHVGGATALFEILHDTQGADELTEFFSSHPLDENRIEHLDALAAERGWSTRGEPTPMPSAFSALTRGD